MISKTDIFPFLHPVNVKVIYITMQNILSGDMLGQFDAILRSLAYKELITNI